MKIILQLRTLPTTDIEHSNGWSPNQYALLNSDVWKEPNNINIDTVLKSKKILKTVSKSKPKRYQNQPYNSISSDTRNHLIKLSNSPYAQTPI